MSKIKTLLINKDTYIKYFEHFYKWPKKFSEQQWQKAYKTNDNLYRIYLSNDSITFDMAKKYFNNNKLFYIDDGKTTTGINL